MNERQGVISTGQEETVESKTSRESRTASERELDRQERGRDDEDGTLADDEDDGHRMSSVFTPLVKVVRKSSDKQMESDVRADDVSMCWENTKNEHDQSCCVFCGEMMLSVVFLLSGLVMFPLLVWGGHDLLPIDVPMVRSAPYRLVYTLRCVCVHGVSCMKFSSLKPLFEGKRASRHTVVHMTYVQDSLRLFLLFFLQLAVTSTYVHQDHLKLVPLLTIVFVFGRLIYWPSVCWGSSVRVLGFSLSFLPILTLMGVNFYFVCSSTGEGAVFDVAPPTTPPPPKARWWG
ncbi:transmembrane protein 79 isoform X2 [Hemibagrus wyckioides]|uniref:transmembrane protein 79 isoform X2 n=1 Tax=Hemibagrus wyckioides TaxID=337641 RepID=UPI00266CA666|nr:transmembrane protein 79 isoform X2 [Hemibagrus wyckioides]